DRDGADDVVRVDPAGTTERRVTANASEDLVLDWQPLHDVVPPRVHAYPVQIAPRRAPMVRFRVSDDSGRARVEIELDTPHLSAGDSVEVTHVRAPRTVSRVLRDFDTTAHEVRSGSYCVLASDPSGNASTKSCAAVRIVKR